MAKFSYEQFKETIEEGTGSGVGFFGLKNDGDEALVRFAVTTLDDLQFITVHNMEIDGKYRKVSCIKSLAGPATECPLCAAGTQLQQRVFIPLLQYTRNATTGAADIKACVWERPAGFTRTINNLINEYGDLKHSVFKIKRSGAPRDMKTKYDIMYANPTVYSEEAYPADFNVFTNFSVLGGMVLEESFANMQLMTTGQYHRPTNTPAQGQPVTISATAPAVSRYQQATSQQVMPQYTQPQQSVPQQVIPQRAAPQYQAPAVQYSQQPTPAQSSPAPVTNDKPHRTYQY